MLMLQALILSQRKRKLAEVLDNMIPFVSWIQTEEFVHMRGGWCGMQKVMVWVGSGHGMG